ncbi:UDP-2,3-diacylglucosamine diphosphatase LpxI [Roseomonas sp. SSH11]|uniref:UDP-2,3-diacylglucosamine diphosphatase LpxI n=1 Tax=Pararoseomonas baculiformis TaxID=2820812 RepID=A0ABS4AGQ2_9PROT|nr:UDP-2,3-diacylglucosamine diphosphatase LpxI [Pararoseomonas baculiformis]MBP0445703.1 UDP-2,3-diacylglucosamine diphosphatase LpxI [Pararoseomonas baculiformis]
MNETPVAIVAGGGAMPLRVAAACRAMGRPFVAVLLEGFARPAEWAGERVLTIRMGAAGQALDWLRASGAKQIVLVGDVRRPSFLSLRPDAGAAKLVARIGMRAFGGDDSLLTAIRQVLQEEGFEPIGPARFLTQAQCPPGLLTRAAPDAGALADIRRGVQVVRALGAVDVGQGAVVQQGLVLAVEAIEGTDAMLARARELRREGAGGVLVKLVKPGQDRELDLPALGPRTVAGAIAAGLSGIAFEAEGALLVDRERMAEQADSAGLFLLAIRPDDHVRAASTGAAT